jgi:Icc-related predicted phosphoesterase
MSELALPKGDILVHAGDMTYRGSIPEINKQLSWLSKNKDKYKEIIVVPGNHDWLFEKQPQLAKQMCKDNGVILLNEEEIIIEGIKFFGSPITPFFCNWAFNRHSEDIQVHWDIIPDDVNVLISHGPALGILDAIPDYESVKIGYDNHYRPIYAKKFIEKRAGCPKLLEKIKELKQLKLHIFGHIHEGYGLWNENGIQFVNASIMDADYKSINRPIIVEIYT